jgi:hypothetical protein
LDFEILNGIIPSNPVAGRPGHFARGVVTIFAAGPVWRCHMDIAVMAAFAVLFAGGIWVLSGMLFRNGRHGGARPV